MRRDHFLCEVTLLHAAMASRAKRVVRACEKRLNRVAASLPKKFVNDAIGDVKRRCQRLYEAEGGFFEEGGRKRRPL